MIRGKTDSGFEFEIEESRLDDMEVLDLMCEIDRDNIAVMPELSDTLFGKKQKKKLYDHLRTEQGNVPIEAFVNEVTEILNKAGEQVKNS